MKKMIAILAGIAMVGSVFGVTGALRVKADETVEANQASVTVNGTTTEYATLEKAFESLQLDAARYATVTLLTDVALTRSLSTMPNERTTVDLNGKKVTGGALLFTGTDTVKDSSQEGTGSVEKNLEVNTDATLTVKGGHFYGDYPLYLYENATAIVAGGSFYAENDVLLNEGSELVLKNAQFPAVDGQYGGFDFADYTGKAKTFADFLDVSAAYYIGETKVEDASSVTADQITSVKQQYVATYEQEGQPTVYITDVGSINNAIYTASLFGPQSFSWVDDTIPATLTLYADGKGGSMTQTLEELTIDLNGNVMAEATHRVETTLHLMDSSTYQTGLLENCSFMLNEWGEVTSEVNITLNCNSYELSIYVNTYGKFVTTGGQHYGEFDLSTYSSTTSAQISLQGGVYEALWTNIQKAEDVQCTVTDISVIGDPLSRTWDLGSGEDYALGDVLADGYMLQYEDGTYEKDLAKHDIYGPFTVLAHEHSYIGHYNADSHWKECDCGMIEAGSEGEHSHSGDVFSMDETAHWYPCDICGAYMSYEGHDYEAVSGTHTNENGYDEHQATCRICGYEGMDSCITEYTDNQPATETEMGYYIYECVCGYTETEAYCDHLGGVTYTKVGTAEDATHEYVCNIEGCGETWTENCDRTLIDEQPATETEMGYYTYECACGYTETEAYCDHLGSVTYTKVGTAEDATHEYVCNIEGCDAVWTEDCSFESEPVYPTDVVDGYYVYTCDCGYTYNEVSEDLTAFGDKTLVTIGGLEMSLRGNAYYVNGENGGVGTVHSEAPATYHAHLTWEAAADGKPIITLAVNGLDLSVTSGSALILADDVGISVSGENNIAATYDETCIAIDMLGDNAIVSEEKNGTMNVTVNAAEDVEVLALKGRVLQITEAVLNVKFNAIGYAIDAQNQLFVDDSTVSVETSAAGIAASAFTLESSTLNVDMKNETSEGGAIETENLSAYRSVVNVSVASNAGMAQGVYAEEYLYAWQSEFKVEITRLTPKSEEETEEETGVIAIGFAGVELEFNHTNVNVSIKDAYYAYAMEADRSIEVIGSTLSVELIGSDMLTGLAINEGYDGGLLIENSTVDIAMSGGASGITVNAEGYTDYGLKIYNSRVNVEMSGENVIIQGIRVDYAPYEDGGAAILIDNSTVIVDTSKTIAQLQHGIYAELEEEAEDDTADAYGLYVKNSKVYTYYGAGIIARGIAVEYNIYNDYNSSKEAMYVRKSTIHSENKIAADWDEETLEDYATWENVALSINADFDESEKYRLITLDDTNVTTVAGDGVISAGFKISIKEESYQSYIEEVLYATDCKLTFISGAGHMETAGLRLNAEEDVYGEFGILLIDCETLVISGEASRMPLEEDFWYGTTAAMYLEMDTSDELLYLEGGRTVLIAPESYEMEEDGETVPYNKHSYALIVDGDDAEIVSGTLEMWAGTYCVDGDLDTKNEVYPASSMTYGDEELDDDFGSDIRFEEDMEEDTPKYVFIGGNEVYVGGLAMADGEYYVNGAYGEVGEVYREEPENWNAKLEAVFDEEGEFVKYVLTLNGLYLAAQENSLLFAQIWSLADLDIVLADGSKNIVEANELSNAYAAYRMASAIDARAWSVEEREDEEYGDTYNVYSMKKGGTITVSGEGELTLAGAENGVTHDGKLYVAMESYFENGVYTLKNLENAVEATDGSWTVKAHAHAYGEWTVTEEATKKEEGSREKICETCGDKVTETIPAKGKGCGSTITGVSFGSIGLLSVFGCLLAKKKREDDFQN
ncbi:MAG: hypothetical protein E7377_00360 [Clostridiales bacterium]|nr:hypothetical protein [Clostridiales bacterium]